MKSNLDHLPDRHQDELAAIVGHLLRGFETATAGGTSVWRRYAKVLKIILLGSDGQGDLVNAPEIGYPPDVNMLVVVSSERLTDKAEYWYETEQRILHDAAIGRAVNLLVDDVDDINKGLEAGLHFFREVIEQGIVLYEVPGHAFRPLKPLDARAAMDLASAYFQRQANTVATKLQLARYAIDRGQVRDWPQTAAFNIHQAVEAAYLAVLLVKGLYAPRSHNIAFLRGLADAQAPKLSSVWPRESRALRKPFEKLQRAYVDARYDQDSYSVTTAELEHLHDRAEALFKSARAICEEGLRKLSTSADGDNATRRPHTGQRSNRLGNANPTSHAP